MILLSVAGFYSEGPGIKSAKHLKNRTIIYENVRLCKTRRKNENYDKKMIKNKKYDKKRIESVAFL